MIFFVVKNYYILKREKVICCWFGKTSGLGEVPKPGESGDEPQNRNGEEKKEFIKINAKFII